MVHFNRIQLYGIAANMIAVPVSGFWIMPWAVIAGGLMPFGIEDLALVPMGWGVAVVIETAHMVAAWPGAVWVIPTMPDLGFVLIVIGGLWFCLWQARWRHLGLAAVAAGFASLAFADPPDMLVDGNRRMVAVRAADGRLACDDGVCTYALGTRTVTIVRDERALALSCRSADRLVTFAFVRRRDCPRPGLLIDGGRLWREGTHAVWTTRDGLRVETVAARRGARPWSTRPDRRNERL